MGRFLVIGLGKFGMTVATKLFENGADVVAIDNDEKLIDEVKGRVSSAILMDSTDERQLKQIGVDEMDGVILAIGNNIEVSVLTSVILTRLGAVNIHAKVDSKLHARILELIGVKNIVFPEEQIGNQLALSMLSSNVLHYYSLSTGHSIVEIEVPRSYVGRTLQDLALPSEKGVHIVAIKYEHLEVSEDGENRMEKRINDMPGANDVIKEGDVLVLLGPQARINDIIRETSELRASKGVKA